MAEPSVSRVLEIIDRHSEEMCRSAYTDENPEQARHCLLGWMAVDAGIGLPPDEYKTHVIGMTGTMSFAGDLQQEYGLSLKQLKSLQFANDDAPDMQALTSKVIEVIQQAAED